MSLKEKIVQLFKETGDDITEYFNSSVPIECNSADMDHKLNSLKEEVLGLLDESLTVKVACYVAGGVIQEVATTTHTPVEVVIIDADNTGKSSADECWDKEAKDLSSTHVRVRWPDVSE